MKDTKNKNTPDLKNKHTPIAQRAKNLISHKETESIKNRFYKYKTRLGAIKAYMNNH